MSDPETLFKALADRTRQRTVGLLMRHELSVSELVEVLHQPQSTISRHLRILRDAKLIQDRRNGSAVLYSVVPTDKGNRGSNGSNLAANVLKWMGEQELAPDLEKRLNAVIRQRREMSDRFFSRVGQHWDTLREESFGDRFHLEAWLALLPHKWTVADLGTGTGYLLPALAAHFDQVIGVDPVETMLEAARGRLALQDVSNVELRHGDLSDLPIADVSVDLAVAILVLHHVPVPIDALNELRRITRGGGRVLIVEQVVHDDESFRDRMQDRWWGFAPDTICGQLENLGYAGIRSQVLATVEPSGDAPELFVITGCLEPVGVTKP